MMTTTASDQVAPNSMLITDTESVAETWDQQLKIQPSDEAFKAFVDHPVLLHHFDWNVAAGTSRSTLTMNLIRAYFTKMPTLFKQKVNAFYYLRCKIKLKFVVQGAAQSFGMMAYSAFPLPKTGVPFATLNDVVDSNSLCNSRIVPHVLIDPSTSASYELILPMCTPTGFYNISSSTGGKDNNGSWELDQRIIVALGTGTTTAATVSVCVYMSLIDPEFTGLRNSVPLAPPLKFEKKPSGTYSTIARGVSKVSNFVGQTFPVLSPFTTIFSEVSDTVGSVLSWLGFSKPNALENLNPILIRTADNYSQVDGISSAIVLGRSQGQTVSIAPGYIGGCLDEMSLDHLCSKPALVKQFNFDATNASQSFLFTIPITPRYTSLPIGNISPLAGLARAHKLWKGDITVTLEFIASVFHRATLLVAWTPVSSATPPSFGDALSVLQNTTVYISGNTSIDITIPYQQPFPALSTKELGVAVDDSQAINGRIFVFVINPMQTNGSTDPIAVNVLMRSENMKFILPSTDEVLVSPQWLAYDENSFDFTPTIVPLAPPIDWVTPTPITFGKAVSSDAIGAGIVGDVTVSVKDLISRMQCPMTLSAPGTNTVLTVMPYPMNTGTGLLRHFLRYFTFAYLGSRGSTRISLVGKSGETFPVVYNTDPFLDGITSEWSTNNIMSTVNQAYAITGINTRISSNADVVVPMTVPYYFNPGRNCGNAGSGSGSARGGFNGSVSFGPMTASVANMAVLKGAGDDFFFSGFIGFPIFSTT